MTSWRMEFSVPDPDYKQRVQESFDRQPMMKTLGVTIARLEPGTIDLEFDHSDQFTQQHGFIHAGAVATVLDSACGYAAFSLMPADAAVLTVEYKVNLVRPAKAHRYRASAQVIKPGRTLTVCQATATSVDDDRVIAVMTGTLMALVGSDIDH